MLVQRYVPSITIIFDHGINHATGLVCLISFLLSANTYNSAMLAITKGADKSISIEMDIIGFGFKGTGRRKFYYQLSITERVIDSI